MKRIIYIILLTFSFSCSNDIPIKELNRIDVDCSIRRFEQELFGMDTDTIGAAISYFYSKYDDFFDIFGYYVIDIGRPTEKNYPGLLQMFVNDNINREVFNTVNSIYPDLTDIETRFEDAFKRYKYYFREDSIPEIVSFIGGFNYPGFTVGNYLGIGLDMYLGGDNEYYRDLGLAEYIVRNMNKDHLVSDALYNWANSRFPSGGKEENVLARMIYEGKLIYLLEKLMPQQPLASLLGFSDDQMKWVTNNEEGMWVYLIENKLLYSNVLMDIQKLTGPAPFTSFFTSESPGRAVVFNGYRIIQEYSKKNPGTDLQEIMRNTDYQDILRLSKYNPKLRR